MWTTSTGYLMAKRLSDRSVTPIRAAGLTGQSKQNTIFILYSSVRELFVRKLEGLL